MQSIAAIGYDDLLLWQPLTLLCLTMSYGMSSSTSNRGFDRVSSNRGFDRVTSNRGFDRVSSNRGFDRVSSNRGFVRDTLWTIFSAHSSELLVTTKFVLLVKRIGIG